ncbi:MAG: hypothetical protein HYZ14_01500 [Bacteroidetes bacterium]|nr:hypothetical protein [Bacteroidota bacterium]
MIRKFNYTGRKKLSKDRVDISIINGKPYKSFSVKLNLKGLKLSDDAKIYIEPYHRSSFMRFYFGTVANELNPESTFLTEIPSTSIVLFRVKIVDETNANGRIVRFADKIRPKNSDETSNSRASILHIDWDQDLDQEIFRITFPQGDFPRLEINRRIENSKELMKNDQIFRALVFPVVVKEVATKIVSTSDEEFEEGDDSWQSIWMRFIKDYLHLNIEIDFKDGNPDDHQYWIEEVVAAFCRKNKFRTKLEHALKGTK